ncbi:MAG: hypothetical protein AAFY42_04135 [Pseudomonadota bacterium]
MSALLAILASTPIIIVNPPRVEISTERDEDAAAWMIIRDGVEMAVPDTPLRKGDTILRQRLVPKRLAVVSEDIVRADNKDRWAEAGDQLFGAKVGDYDAYCVLKSKFNMSLRMFVVPTSTRLLKQDCFVDRDGDGRLDQRFEADPGIGVLPNVARSEPKAFYDLKPVEFRELAPEEFKDDNWVELEFRGGGGKKDKRPELRIRYRYDGKTRKIDGQYVGANSFPSEAYLLGATLEFKKLEDGKLAASVIRPMDSSFGVTTRLVSF